MSALFNFESFLTVVLLVICTCTYVKIHFPKVLEKKTGYVDTQPSPVTVAGFHSGPLQSNDESKYNAFNFSVSYVLPIAVKAVLELGIPDILAKADGRKPLLAPLVPICPPKQLRVTNLRRYMRPLLQQGFFAETLNNEKHLRMASRRAPSGRLDRS